MVRQRVNMLRNLSFRIFFHDKKKVMKINLTVLISLIISLCLIGCGGREFKKSPLDQYITEFSNEATFSVIIEDMDVDGTFFKTYKHLYKVIRNKKDGTPYSEITGWTEVGKDFFWANENNLGMTVLEKDGEGKISKAASPPGYGYVGNSRYGEWRSNYGNSFWAFYGQYMFMSHMFGMTNRPVYRSHYNSYRSGGYYGGKGYYGPKSGSSTMYGTNSAQTKKSNPNFFQRRSTKSGWSSSRSRTGGRSRGSGFGK